MHIKSLIAALLVISLIFSLCAAVTAEETPALAGSWRVCGGTDGYDTLVFHEDGTMEAYAYLDVYAPTDKGLLLFCGEYRIDGTDIKLPNGDLYRMEVRAATEEDDLTIGNALMNVEKDDQLLFLSQDPEGESQVFGIYVGGFSYPGIPAEEYLMNRAWIQDGKAFAFSEDMLENGRLLYDGVLYSLQCQILPIPEDLSDEELNRLNDEEMLLTDDPETGTITHYLSEKEIIAYPLGSGEPLLFTMAEEESSPEHG